jgi:hypothetical protein
MSRGTLGQAAVRRAPPTPVIRQLRQEVGFRCPVDGCGSPYLTWHHFDPAWRDEQRHRPPGMIALCVEHAAKADGGAFTDDQLRTLKREGRAHADAAKGRFDWMRRDLLAVVGGNFYYRCPVVLQIGDRNVIWFSRDNAGSLLLNFWMPTASGQERARILENFWVVPPAVQDLECPPSGKRIHVHYANGDETRVEFFEIDSLTELIKRYPETGSIVRGAAINWPITGVELWEKAPGTQIEFGPKVTRIGGIQISGSFMSDIGGAGIHLDLPPGVGGLAFHDEDIILSDLVSADSPVLDRMSLRECRIFGPAVLVPVGGTQLKNSSLGGPPQSVLWPLPDLQTVVGAIVASGCVFDGCEFFNVGFGMPPDQIPALRGELTKG